MSLIIRIKDADYSASGLPKLEKTIFGFPAEGLIALYLCEDGTSGQELTTLIDSSGNGNHATLWTGYANPRRTADKGGIVTGSDLGVGFDTGIPITAEKTLIWAGKHTIPNWSAGNNGYPTQLSSTESLSATSNSHNRCLATNYNLSTQNSYEVNTFGAYSADSAIGDEIGKGTSRWFVYKNLGHELGVEALTLGQNGYLSLKSKDGTTKTDTFAGLVDYEANRNGNHAVGLMRHNAVGCTGEVQIVALYDRVLDSATFSQAWAAARSRMIQRGQNPL